MERLCLDCQKPVRGRADKKFCNDACRTTFNNTRKIEVGQSIKEINLILKRNRNILKEKSANGNRKVKREALLRNGFNFDFHTHLYKNENGETYFFCYEHGYLGLNNEEVLVVRQDEQ
jgi:YHS domain-containing protein